MEFSRLPMTVVPGTTCSGAMVVTLPEDAMFLGGGRCVERFISCLFVRVLTCGWSVVCSGTLKWAVISRSLMLCEPLKQAGTCPVLLVCEITCNGPRVAMTRGGSHAGFSHTQGCTSPLVRVMSKLHVIPSMWVLQEDRAVQDLAPTSSEEDTCPCPRDVTNHLNEAG